MGKKPQEILQDLFLGSNQSLPSTPHKHLINNFSFPLPSPFGDDFMSH